IDAKKYGKEGWLRWFVESRGVNDAERLKNLIVVGVPCRPVNRLAAEFAILNGRSPATELEVIRRKIEVTNKQLPSGLSPYFENRESADKEFRDYIRRDNLATIHQGFGRLRANRRAGEDLDIWFLGDFPLDVPVELKRAVDVTPEGGDRLQQMQLSILQFFRSAQDGESKLTLTALATHCEASKQRLSQVVRELGWSRWTEFKNCLVPLLQSYSETRQKSGVEFEEFIDLSFEDFERLTQGLFVLLAGAGDVTWRCLLGILKALWGLSRRKLRVRAPSVPFLHT
ncbi:MAG TPA: hypothetical protein VK211_03030, partial [Kamptonema sp.]|nr:hypothetical protein [Kamptonema sp.]